jgi:hypothetical protein
MNKNRNAERACRPILRVATTFLLMTVRVLTAPKDNAYPVAEARDGREGWVRLNMMIDPEGQTLRGYSHRFER